MGMHIHTYVGSFIDRQGGGGQMEACVLGALSSSSSVTFVFIAGAVR